MENSAVEKTTISVVIVNYNAGDYLVKCVESVLATDEQIEIWISDNASTDNSIELVLQRFPHHKRIFIQLNQTNLGFAAANNAVLSKTQGEYILFLNPDCIVKPNTLHRMHEVMDENPQAGMAGCLIRNSDETIQATCIRKIPNLRNTLVRLLHLNKLISLPQIQSLDMGDVMQQKQITAVEGISGAFMWVRRTALMQVGLLDEKYFMYGEDLDWMLRFQLKKWQILFVPDVEIIHVKGVCGNHIPLTVLWHKHKAMRLFYGKFLQNSYPGIVRYTVHLAIWLRFLLLTSGVVLKRILLSWPKGIVQKFKA